MTGCLVAVLAVTSAFPARPAAAADPAANSVTMQTSWTTYKLRESEIYRFTAAPGPIQVQLTGIEQNARLQVMVQDAQTDALILHDTLQNGDRTTVSGTIPKQGEYVLLLGPNLAASVQLDAVGLNVAPGEVPALRLPEMKNFQTLTAPVDMTPALANPGGAESITVTLNDQVLQQNALAADATVAKVDVDPAKLDEGIYLMTAVAKGKGAGHVAVNARTFLVDRLSSFPDVGPEHWARRPVEVLHHMDVIAGAGDGQFHPTRPVRRDEFAKMVAVTLGLKPTYNDPQFNFADVPDGWAKEPIVALAERGFVLGGVVDGKRYFYPEQTITRAEAATILGRVLGVAPTAAPGASSTFPDFDTVPDYARSSVLYLSRMEWVKGYTDGKFHPTDTLGRDQAAKLISNFVGMQ